MSVAAFFDLDNTVVRGSSLIPFAWRLLRTGRVSTSEMVRFASMNARFVKSRTESASGRDFVMQRALALAAGQSVTDVLTLCDDVVPDLVRRRLNPAVAAQIRLHQRSGHQTWLVTASPNELAERIARELDMTGAMGTQAERLAGVYSGNLAGPILHGRHKAEAVSALAAVEDLDLSRCAAFSDSINDLPLLVLVGRPTVVNANRRLRQIALRNGWQILGSGGSIAPRRRLTHV
jgi:HAD superfamily hydrolase (TIGR01490 family)